MQPPGNGAAVKRRKQNAGQIVLAGAVVILCSKLLFSVIFSNDYRVQLSKSLFKLKVGMAKERLDAMGHFLAMLAVAIHIALVILNVDSVLH